MIPELTIFTLLFSQTVPSFTLTLIPLRIQSGLTVLASIACETLFQLASIVSEFVRGSKTALVIVKSWLEIFISVISTSSLGSNCTLIVTFVKSLTRSASASKYFQAVASEPSSGFGSIESASSTSLSGIPISDISSAKV